MPANHVGPSRAIIQRSYRRGYLSAVDDVIAAISGQVSQPMLGRFYQWRRNVERWRKRATVGTDEAIEHERAPQPLFHGRDPADQ